MNDDVKKEAGGAGDSYQHNKFLREAAAFGAAIRHFDRPGHLTPSLLPFDEHYLASHRMPPQANTNSPRTETEEEKIAREKAARIIIEENMNLLQMQTIYEANAWRKIDYDWLYSAGAFALRMNGLTNNLSLALAIEFEESVCKI